MEFRSLKYIASASAPDQTLYTLWIELNGSGKAIALKYYSGGAWKDVYEDKFLLYPTSVQVSAAIAAAISAQASLDATARNQYPFRARKSAAAQIYTAGTGDQVVVFDIRDYGGASYSTSTNAYTAPVAGKWSFKASTYISLDSGAPTGIDRQLKIRVNGVAVARKNVQVNDLTGGQTIDIQTEVQLNANDIVDVVVNVTSTGASTWSLLNDSTETFFVGHRLIDS